MNNTFGNGVSVTLFGESRGSAVGVVIDGLSPGIAVDESEIASLLSRRGPRFEGESERRETDGFELVSGVFNSKTTGTPICIIIRNTDAKSDGAVYGEARPSHADYAAYAKYHGNEDYRGGGHFSGRVTAALVAAGGIILPALRRVGVNVGTHILRCGNVLDRAFGDACADVKALQSLDFPALRDGCAEEMLCEISNAAKRNDSIGGITQTAVTGLPAGVGEPWFDSVESVLSHALFGIGGIKGIGFGAGFGFAGMSGSECADELASDGERVYTLTNNNGGVNGGLTNGMPVVFDCAVKPTPSVPREYSTYDFVKKKNVRLRINGRHDAAIIRRICPVIDSVSAIAVCDLLCRRFGTDVLTKGIRL